MTRVIGHRGAAGIAPENTLSGFETALEHDVDAVEFDVRRAADGALVVCHDETVDRTTDGAGAVGDHTAAELASLDAGNGEGIPTVADVLEALASTDVALQIELKESGVAEDLLALLAERDLRDRAVLTSFDEDILESVAGTASETALLTATVDARAFERAEALAVEYVCMDLENLDASTVRRAHDRELQIGFWSVNDREDIEAVLDSEADVLSTDRPDRVAELR
ncbi:MAG: glycerophosphodiester phosphodiesterase [Halosimplex sp.]